jgi:uncharacterized phage protein (TIGR02218 family)
VKTQSAELAAHRALGTTTLAWCWKVTRRDEQVFGFTSVDQSFEFEGVTYAAATGMTPSAIAGNADLAVRNLEAAGMLEGGSLTDADILAGLWDGAEVEIFEVNYEDLTMGRMILATGTIGNISTGRNNFTAEIRGLAQALQQPTGEIMAPGCQARFGDARCKFPVETLREAFTVSAVTDGRTFAAAALNDDNFTAGEITWVTGANAGLRREIREAGPTVMLVLPMPYVIAPGDTGTAIPGCQKRRDEDCLTRYDNVVNFRGFPDLPGNDKILGTAALVGGQG